MQQVLNLLYLHKMLKGECMTEPPPQPQNERGKAKVKRKKKREELPNIWEKYSSIIFWALHRKMGPVVWSCCASQAMDVSYDNLDILILLILLRLTYESTSSSVHCACFSYVLLIKFAKFLCSIIQNLFFLEIFSQLHDFGRSFIALPTFSSDTVCGMILLGSSLLLRVLPHYHVDPELAISWL